MDEKLSISYETEEETLQMVGDQRNIHFIALWQPPVFGVTETVTLLKHRDYPPDTFKNELFLAKMFSWGGMLWLLVSIPKEDKALMEEAAGQFDVKIDDGSLLRINNDKDDPFPIQGKNVYWLLPDDNNLMHRNDPDVNDAYKNSFSETLEHIVQAHRSTKPLH